MQIIEIRMNCPSREVAEAVSRSLLERRLIAASNIHPMIESSYHWKGSIGTAKKVPLVMKTRAELFDQIVKQARTLHPYETPGITAIAIAYVNDDYKAWVLAETADVDC